MCDELELRSEKLGGAGAMAETPIVLIRAYTPEDEAACKEIVTESLAGFTTPMFFQTLFRETVYEVMVFCVAVAFIFFGVPFKVTLLLVPVVVAATYVCIRMSNAVKAMELQQDLSNVRRKYDPDRGGKFFVAELCECPGVSFEQAAALKSAYEREMAISSFFYLFEGHYNETAFYSKILGSKKHVIGMVGVCASERDSRRGFLKRLFVRKTYQKSILPEKLMEAVIQHSRDFGFVGVDAACTDVNEELRESLFAKGFTISLSYHRYLLGVSAYMGVHLFSVAMKASRSSLEA